MGEGPVSSTSVATLFSRRVRPGYEEQYESWLAGIAEASGAFPGSRGTTIVRPSGNRREYVAIIHFEDPERLSRWLDSDERADWLQRLEAIPVEFEEVRALTGLESCFVLPGESKPLTPPRYKTAILVFTGLYPLVLTLGYLLEPALRGLPRPVGVFLSLTVSVPLMVYFVLPGLTRLFHRWLQSESRR